MIPSKKLPMWSREVISRAVRRIELALKGRVLSIVKLLLANTRNSTFTDIRTTSSPSNPPGSPMFTCDWTGGEALELLANLENC